MNSVARKQGAAEDTLRDFGESDREAFVGPLRMKPIKIESEAEQKDEIPRPISTGNKVRRDVEEKQIHPCLMRQQPKAPKNIWKHGNGVSHQKP